MRKIRSKGGRNRGTQMEEGEGEGEKVGTVSIYNIIYRTKILLAAL